MTLLVAALVGSLAANLFFALSLLHLLYSNELLKSEIKKMAGSENTAKKER